MVKRLLLLLDGSPAAAVASQNALALAAAGKARLLIAPLADKTRSDAEPQADAGALAEVVRAASAAELDFEVASTGALSLTAAALLAATADLAIVPYRTGASVRRTEKRVVRLLCNAGCAVLLPAEIEEAEPAATAPVAVAWDGSAAAARALRMHLLLLASKRQNYLLLHFNRDPLEAEAVLARGAAIVSAFGSKVETVALSGAPDSRLAQLCAAASAATLILAPHSRPLYTQERLGRFSRRTLQQAPASLFLFG